VPWLFVAGREAPFAAAPDVEGAAEAAVDAAGVAFAGDCFAGLETVGLTLDGVELAAFVGVDEAPAPPLDFAAPPAGFVAVDEAADDSVFAGCLGVAGFVDGVVVLFRPASRDGVPAPPTVALPTVALPTAAEARAGPPEF